MKHPPRLLTAAQQVFIEASMPTITTRGGWMLRTCAAGPNHVHVLLDVPTHIHGEQVRRLIKRWIGQALNQRWPLPDGASWWAEEGSNKAISDVAYLQNAYNYVFGQRASVVAGAEDGPARTDSPARADGPARCTCSS